MNTPSLMIITQIYSVVFVRKANKIQNIFNIYLYVQSRLHGMNSKWKLFTNFIILLFLNKLFCTCQVPSSFTFLETSEYLENPFSRKGHFIKKKNSLKTVGRLLLDSRLTIAYGFMPKVSPDFLGRCPSYTFFSRNDFPHGDCNALQLTLCRRMW